MRKYLIILFLLICPQAKAERQVLFFHTSWCHYCPAMVSAMKQPENVALWQKYNGAFLIDTDVYSLWRKTFNVTGIPEVIIVDTPEKKGGEYKILQRFSGQDAGEMNMYLKKYAPTGPLKKLKTLLTRPEKMVK